MQMRRGKKSYSARRSTFGAGSVENWAACWMYSWALRLCGLRTAQTDTFPRYHQERDSSEHEGDGTRLRQGGPRGDDSPSQRPRQNVARGDLGYLALEDRTPVKPDERAWIGCSENQWDDIGARFGLKEPIPEQGRWWEDVGEICEPRCRDIDSGDSAARHVHRDRAPDAPWGGGYIEGVSQSDRRADGHQQYGKDNPQWFSQFRPPRSSLPGESYTYLGSFLASTIAANLAMLKGNDLPTPGTARCK